MKLGLADFSAPTKFPCYRMSAFSESPLISIFVSPYLLHRSDCSARVRRHQVRRRFHEITCVAGEPSPQTQSDASFLCIASFELGNSTRCSLRLVHGLVKAQI